jgi:hypothetical protein
MHRAGLLVALSVLFVLGGRPVLAQQKHFETLDELKKQAEQGDLEAEFQLGFAYAYPKRTDINPPETAVLPPDFVEAAKWLQKAADQGYAPAESALGAVLASGALGGNRIGEALNWERKAAEKSSAPAETMLGVMLYYGEISTVRTFHVPTAQDKAEGLRWLHKGEADGDDRAHDELQAIAIADEHQAKEAAEEAALIQQAAIVTGTLMAVVAVLVTAYLTVWKRLTVWLKTNAERRRRKKIAAVERRRILTDREKVRREIEPLALKRWPEHLFPRIPRYLLTHLQAKPGSDFDDEAWLRWRLLLERYPEGPKSDAERQEREMAFWLERVDLLLNPTSVGKKLLPKQDIIDAWWAAERYYFRRYFAATGIHHPSVYSDRFIRNLEILHPPRKTKGWDTNGATERHRMNEKNRAETEVKDFWDKEVPAHKERWGEWFFLNVEQAFRREYGDPERKRIEGENPL